MGDFDPSFVHALAVQSWSLYGVGILLISIRIYARIHRLGVKNLQTDDYLMVLVAALYTLLIVCLNVISGGGGSNLYPPEQFATFTPQEIQDRIEGSKIVIVSEQAMLNVIYTIKACMLLMYTRLTLGLQVQRAVRYLSIYVFLGWLGTEIAFFTACRPFVGYWAMPPADPQCTTLQNYAIVQGIFNISSDALMLFIPLPLVTRLSIPLKQKSVLFVVFGLGLFVIIAAILTKVFNLMNLWDPLYMLWYTRESSVAIYVSNLPMIWPLLREWFPVLRGLAPIKSSSQRRAEGYGTKSSRPRTTIIGGRHLGAGGFGGKRLSDSGGGGGVLTTIKGKGHDGSSMEELSGEGSTSGATMEMNDIARIESWEEEEGKGGRGTSAWGVGGGGGHGDDMEKGVGIKMTTTVVIAEEHVKGVPSPGLNQVSVMGNIDVSAERKKGFAWGFDHERSAR